MHMHPHSIIALVKAATSVVMTNLPKQSTLFVLNLCSFLTDQWVPEFLWPFFCWKMVDDLSVSDQFRLDSCSVKTGVSCTHSSIV